MYGRSTTAHCPQAMRQCEARFPMPTALRRRGSALQCPLPSAQNNSTAGRTQCSIVHSTKQCKCSAQHQAVQHHTNSADGAARHAGCSGTMRPCVTARRRRQGSVGQVRKCTGPAMQQHTYTQRAHNTHSPARLPVPVGRHPGLCLLVIAPSAHHTTPHHTTPTTPRSRKLPKGCVTGALGSRLKQPLGSVAWHGGRAASVLWAVPPCGVTAGGGENKGVGAKITSGEPRGPSPLPHGHEMTWPVLSPQSWVSSLSLFAGRAISLSPGTPHL